MCQGLRHGLNQRVHEDRELGVAPMLGLSESLVFATVLLAQSTGLVSTVLARLHGQRADQTWSRRIYYMSLLFVGLMMISAVLRGGEYWISLAATTAVMVVGATIDFGNAGGRQRNT